MPVEPHRKRAALVCCALGTLGSPAAAQWFEHPETVSATNDAESAPPNPGQPPAAPAQAAPPAAQAAPPVASGASAIPGAAAPTVRTPEPAAKAPTVVPGPTRPGSAVPLLTAAAQGEAAAKLGFRIAVSAEAAFGRDNRFRNYLFGPRLDLRFTERTAIGYAVRYANLEGPDERAHNALHSVTLEQRLFPQSGTGFALPLRMSGGYLPKNGPFLQPAAGVGFITERVELLLLPLAPTFWNTGNQTWISYDVALEVGVRL